MSYRYSNKRLLDIFFAFFALLILSPLILLLALFVGVFLGRPVIFRQNRPGLHSVTFEIFKFRTMRNIVDTQGNLLPDEERLTKFGCFLRASSLDELPELLNVLEGKMSLVGPRPLLGEYLKLYSPEQARRHEVRPGITGWAQVNGRNTLSWEEKFDLDVWYVDNHTLRLDLMILFMTIATIVRRKGISHTGEATMPRFLGNQSDEL